MSAKKSTLHLWIISKNMLDIKWIREHPEELKNALDKRGAAFDIEGLLKMDDERRMKIKEVEDLRAKHNKLSDAVAKASGGEREELLKESKAVKSRLSEEDESLKFQEASFDSLLRQIPNIPDPDVPVGKDEHDNKVLREVGEKTRFTFTPQDYMQIATRLNLVDTERAGKASGSRFGYLKNEAVLSEFALVQLAFDRLAKRGFTPIVPPVMIREEMMRGMGYIDSGKDREERYFLEKDNLFLVGTSEQSVVPMHADEIFDEKDLPRRYVAFSTCFRREAGSYGKDTRGILRVHQFDKVEMVSFVKPEDSKAEHQSLLQIEEELMQELRIPYRVAALCTGDLAHPSAATYDIEAWLPGQNEGKGQYRETHSCSNTTDFQARRLGVKLRRRGKTEFVHILNGTAFAIGRMIIAILENYQQEDGSVQIPEALQKYMGMSKIHR